MDTSRARPWTPEEDELLRSLNWCDYYDFDDRDGDEVEERLKHLGVVLIEPTGLEELEIRTNGTRHQWRSCGYRGNVPWQDIPETLYRAIVDFEASKAKEAVEFLCHA